MASFGYYAVKYNPQPDSVFKWVVINTLNGIKVRFPSKEKAQIRCNELNEIVFPPDGDD